LLVSNEVSTLAAFGAIMLTIQDCIELSGLSEEEILAIAEHEHVPEMIAVELGNYLVQTATGEKRIKAMIVDDMRAARERGDHVHVLKLKLCLRHFLEHHAESTRRSK
jgi:predicted transcriptional regulator of viral defense system